ncbi:hypothetical protein BDV28DRAFT_64871 [Aspergillus coremiiformis]|uniref:Uncharacterized protein n=1 Tax=Aspergillus coremiiformis TaxID=138285 RepID=A0A5N6ZGC2_9EURO|nr:hypothetical protein BDV28DRAFT_64871 [Aspergillus coremiiformis]
MDDAGYSTSEIRPLNTLNPNANMHYSPVVDVILHPREFEMLNAKDSCHDILRQWVPVLSVLAALVWSASLITEEEEEREREKDSFCVSPTR